MSKLPEQLRPYVPVLGTAKESNVVTFRAIYGPVSSVDPENVNEVYQAEPRNIDPTVAARFKTRRIMEGYREADGRSISALGADVVFVNSIRHLKPETPDFDRQAEIDEAVEWYCSDAFVVHWLIAFAVETAAGLKRIAVLDVEGKYLKPLEELDVRAAYNEKINARVPLVEVGTPGQAEFTISNSHHDEKISITHELAQQLVVNRVLPPALLGSLIEDEATEIEGWELVVLNLLATEPSLTWREQLADWGQELKNRIITGWNGLKTRFTSGAQRLLGKLNLPKGNYRL